MLRFFPVYIRFHVCRDPDPNRFTTQTKMDDEGREISRLSNWSRTERLDMCDTPVPQWVCLHSVSLTQSSACQGGRRSSLHPGLPVSVPRPSQTRVGLTSVGSRQLWQHPDTITWFMGACWEWRGDDRSHLTPAVLSAAYQVGRTLRHVAVSSSTINCETLQPSESVSL